MASLETDSFLTAVRTVLLDAASLPELTLANMVVWHHGETDAAEDISSASAKCGGVAVIIYDLGGNETSPTSDILQADAVVELYIQTSKRPRSRAGVRLGGEIRDSIMRALHRAAPLRNTAAFFDSRVTGYQPLADPEFTAWRITLSRSIYLEL